MLLLYNVVYLMPVLLVLAARLLLGHRADRVIAGFLSGAQRFGTRGLALALVVVGLVLSGIGVQALT